MNIYRRCATLFAACGGAAFVSRLHRKSHEEKQAHKAELQDWENEGGTLAPSVDASDWRVTTGSA
jgi:hypothetical protein